MDTTIGCGSPPVSDHLKKGINLSATKALKWQHHRQNFGMRAALMETAIPPKKNKQSEYKVIQI